VLKLKALRYNKPFEPSNINGYSGQPHCQTKVNRVLINLLRFNLFTGSTRKKRVIILTKAKPGSMHNKNQLDEEK
jgi:hypothetical protein